MKIREIRFKNINSLRGEHRISFAEEPLASAGLFAITGPTGSGKTTLLDVITLAIYNQIPRISEKISRGSILKTGSLLTRNTHEAYAEVYYECAKGNYVTRWEISTARTGNLRDYDMQIANADTGAIIESSRTKVPEENASIIGLNYEQFIRSILLAQGDFARFLKAKKEERSDLLEKITGGWIYRELGKKAFEHFREHHNQLKELNRDEEKLREQLLEQEAFQQIQKELKELDLTLELTQKNIANTEIELKVREDIDRLSGQKSRLSELALKKDEELQKFESKYEESLRKYKSLMPLEEELRNWKSINRSLEAHLAKKESVQTGVRLSKEKTIQVHKKLEDLTKESFTPQKALEVLGRFEKKVSSMESLIHDMKKEYATRLEELQGITLRFGLQIDSRDPGKGLVSMQKELSSINSKVDGLLKECGLKDPDIQDLDQLYEDKMEMKQHLISFIKARSELQITKNDILAKGKAILKIKERLAVIPISLKEETDLMNKVAQTIEKLEEAHRRKILEAKYEEDRLNLKEEEPCPLCGSVHHPWVSDYQSGSDDPDTKLHEAKNNLRTLERSVASLETEQLSLQKSLADDEVDIQKLKTSRDQIEKTIAELNDLLTISEDNDAGEEKDKLEKLLVSIKDLKQLIPVKEAIGLAVPRLSGLAKLAEKGMAARQELRAVYQGDDIRKEADELRTARLSAELKLAEVEKGFKEWEQAGKDYEKELEGLTAKLNKSLHQIGFNSPETAYHQLMPIQDFNELQERHQALARDLKSIRDEIRFTDQQLAELRGEKEIAVLDELKQKLEIERKKQNRLRTERDPIITAIAKQYEIANNLKQLKKEESELRKKNEKWRLINDYIGDSTGNKFSVFAQQLTLRQLLVLANKRLNALSDRYVLGIPLEGDDDALMITDLDMGSERRSVRTLSGGESFLVSLSLALALSDLAARNIDINSLFIDEGFGTLDPQTLDLTLDTLEKLQAESNKTIGVISHVDALKERISTQIELVPQGQGFSKPRVITKI